MKEQNAIIKSTMLGIEDHGCLTCYLHLLMNGSGQGFGGYRLDAPKGYSIYTDFWIKRILETVGVNEWENLKGKHIRICGDSSQIDKIGHIIEDKWFSPKEEIKKLEEEKC